MSADLKRVRDGAVDEFGSPASKKRAMSVNTPPRSDDGEDEKLEDWMKVVETKRKEAIYRQMLEYRRSYRAEKQRTHDLEAQQRILEASVQAVEVCWTQLVNAVRDMAGTKLEIQDKGALEPKLEVRCRHGQLEKALQSRLPVTQQLVKGFATLASQGGLRATASDELNARCQQMQAETNSLRSSEKLLQSQVGSLRETNADLKNELDRARKALDRQKMEFDKERLELADSAKGRSRDTATPGAKANGSGAATPNGKVEEDSKPSVPTAPADVVLQDTSELERIASTRLADLETLRQQHAALQQEHDRLRVERADDAERRADASEAKHDDIRQTNGTFREMLVSENRQEVEVLKQNIARKDEEAARLRGQRDDMQAQLSERKAKEAEKIQFIDQIESLANSRQERINHLTSEVKRLKAKLGAQAGSEGYLAFLREDGGIDGDYVKDLEAKVELLQAQMPVPGENPSQDAQVELQGVRKTLARYERILGPDPTAAEDVQHLAKKLEEAEKDKRSLQLQLSEAEAATNALYTEIDGLSGLYEELDKKVKSKCFELKDYEMKTQRLITEKAKADNKYFAAMRAKDVLDAETKTAQRTVDRQNKLLEKAQETEKSLQGQIVAQEQAITKLKTALTELQKQGIIWSSEKTTLELQLQHVQKHLAEAQQIMHVRVADSATDKSARRKLEEEVEASTKTIKKLKERQEALVAAPSRNDMSAPELHMKGERDKLWQILRCSCCEQNLKNQVITKCFHTFCKGCLDSRVASRQRKCPACGTGFAKEDVQTLYWQ